MARDSFKTPNTLLAAARECGLDEAAFDQLPGWRAGEVLDRILDTFTDQGKVNRLGLWIWERPARSPRWPSERSEPTSRVWRRRYTRLVHRRRLRVDETWGPVLGFEGTLGAVFATLDNRALRPQIQKELPLFDLAEFDRLEDLALALSYAQTSYLTVTLPPDDLQAIFAEASKVRETLLADAQALAGHGLIDEAKLSQLRGAVGYKNVAQDLLILGPVLQENWASIEGKSPLSREDLDGAFRISARLMGVVGVRE